jgi:hypothetical protein
LDRPEPRDHLGRSREGRPRDALSLKSTGCDHLRCGSSALARRPGGSFLSSRVETKPSPSRLTDPVSYRAAE